MRYVLLLFLISLQIFAKEMPIYFIGTFNENDTMLKEHYINKLDGVEDDGWALTRYTEKLLKNDFKHLIKEDKLNLLTAKDFNKNIEKIISSSKINIKDRRIAFFNLDSDYREFNHHGTRKVELTLNLIFVQIGEEKNRNTEHNSFEVKYSSGVSYISRVYAENVRKDASLFNLYEESFKQTLNKLLNNINNDISRKNTAFGLSKNDLFFIIKSFKVGKKARSLVNEIFDDENVAQNVLMIMFQESLIKKIRENKELDNIVLFYPSKLNKKIFKNWKRYLNKLNKISRTYKDPDARVVIRDIKPLCENIKDRGRIKYFDGYHIKALLSSLEQAKTQEEDEAHIKVTTARTLSQVLIPLKNDLNLDALSDRNNQLRKLKLYVGQKSEGIMVANTLSNTRKSVVLTTVNKAIDKLAENAVQGIKKVNSLRKNNLSFKLKYLCKE